MPMNRISIPQRQCRRGMTLIEVVVVVVIVGLLLSIILPATQMARESARTMNCRSNFHQIGVAIANYESAFGVLPFGEASNALFGILPFAGYEPAASAVKSANWNFSDPLVASISVPLFVCPSDTIGIRWRGLRPNYLPNEGTGIQTYGFNGISKVGDQRCLRRSDLKDGSANTVMMSERRIWEQGIADERRAWFTLAAHRGSTELEDFVTACEGTRVTPVYPTIEYFDPGVMLITHTGYGYDHILPPNSPSCFNGPPSDPLSTSVFAISASSSHRGGVNVLLAAGDVRFVANNIDRRLWRAFGSRNGREVL